ncbi:polysaccharide biosynthesis/export family protein [Autumnicola musiva]|uniref:Polysaccharide biosynthesis/export family protein n=1 Tax=Autumnicola musiva TaxID=3075589 RepID=A0ABU3D384_9FLAO|nr:polysaccharide biosynthesis/export family protein [Zunongwangia sp. F117]MDT0675830.1 polysaccharide biosynthesis/export family protein [Zunongwangia sp. F117]
MKIKNLLLLLLPFIVSCSGSRDLSYFSDFSDKEVVYTENIPSVIEEPVIQPSDILSIKVNSLNPEANAPFNRNSSNTSEGNSSSGDSESGYLVDSEGNIDFPVLGSIKVAGLTKSEFKEKLTQMLSKYLGDPIVAVRYLNYRITVIGEVNNPSTFVIPSERVSIIEALGMAGDLTVYGKRDNVLLIKEAEGVRRAVRLNLNKKEVLNSPYFYLGPNDVLYVEPVNYKKEQASSTRNNISLILSIISVGSLILLNLN